MVNLLVGRIALQDQDHDSRFLVKGRGFRGSICDLSPLDRRDQPTGRKLTNRGKPGNVPAFGVNRRGQWARQAGEKRPRNSRLPPLAAIAIPLGHGLAASSNSGRDGFPIILPRRGSRARVPSKRLISAWSPSLNNLPNSVTPRIFLMSGLLGGGAANAAKRLLVGLRDEGIEAQLLYPPKLKLKSPVTDPDTHRLQWQVGGLEGLKRGLRFRLHRESFKRKVRGRKPGQEIFTSPRGAPFTPWPPVGIAPQSGDVLHLHWISKFVDYESFFASLPRQMPVVWTLHDMNPFTGGCHFTEGCRQFTTGCGNCPQLPQRGENDISSQFFETKRHALRDINLHVVTVSRWMMEQAKQSRIFENVRSFHRIPYGLALDEFQPQDRAIARKELGLSPDAFVFSFGAADIANRRKGFGLLLDSLQSIADVPQATGLVFGGGELPSVNHPIPELRSMGFVSDIKKMMTIYAASDVFLLPSTEDNLPLTCLESLASGTPVLAFDAGGVPDMVRPGETGWLAETGNASAFGQQLKYVTQHPEEIARFGENARQVALTEYSREREAKAYRDLYATLLAASIDAA